jgi:hypothetical protein
MKRFVWVFFCLFICALALCQQPQIQVQGGVCALGSARISFLAPDLVRLEWSEKRQFADWPSAVVVKRDWPAVQVKAETGPDGTVILSTDKLTVRYRPPDRFSKENLSIVSPLIANDWHPGDADPGNLLGTRHSLDGVNESNLPALGTGLLSRSGWFFHDDTGRPLLSPQTNWLVPREDRGAADWYFCAYGHDYRRALALGSDLFGHVYMPPKWAFGAWYSRYWPYKDEEERAIVKQFRAMGVPLDVLVIDVDWHPNGWESYDWNEQLFPDVTGFLAWVHEQGCKVTLNNHPGQLPAGDSHFTEICKRLGIDSKGRESVGLNMADQAQAAASFEVLRQPLHKQGVDFWWIDGNSAGMDGLDSQQWTSRQYFDYTEKFTGKRGLLFARYGGPGDRYPVGFSGDTFSQWGVLGYEVMFTSRAGNVLFPYWSHDIGGFMGDREPADLYVRWLQFGALSPILRLHSNHGVREPWEYGQDGMDAARTYFRLRYALLPYIYSYARRVWETGEPLCKPLYLDWPEEEEAYRHDDEYLFGDAILVAPVAEAAPEGQPSRRQVWLPPGDWVDFWSGQAYASGTLTYEADLQRLPMFLRRGSIVVEGPVGDYVGQKRDDSLRAILTAGQPAASFKLYEDDGESKGYQTSDFAVTELKLKPGAKTDTAQVLTISAAAGHFRGQVERRRWTVEVRGRFAPARVLLDGKPVSRRPDGRDVETSPRPNWRFDPATVRTYIYLPERPVSHTYEVSLQGGGDWRDYGSYWQVRHIAEGLRAATKKVARLPGNWTAYAKAWTDAANQADALETLLATGKSTLADVGADYTKLTEQYVPAVADAAARGAADADSRYQALAAVLDVGVSGRLSVSEDGKTARLVPMVQTGPLAAGARMAESLRGPGGVKASEAGLTVSFDRFFPVGLFDVSLPLTGTWGNLPLATTVSATANASWLQLFHLVGTFDNTDRKGVTADYPPEHSFKTGEPWPGKSGPVTWLATNWRWPTAPKPEPFFIDLVPLFTPHENTVAYAAAYVWAPKDMDALVLMGTDDEGTLWVNGTQVFTFPNPRPPMPDEDHIAIKLRAGWNTVLVKVCQEGGQWGLYLRLADPEGKPLRGLWTALTPEGTPPSPLR